MLLEGKKLLITGVLDRKSIAFSAAEEAQKAGAEIVLTSFGRVANITKMMAKKLPTVPAPFRRSDARPWVQWARRNLQPSPRIAVATGDLPLRHAHPSISRVFPPALLTDRPARGKIPALLPATDP